jgi:hypothetical protein
MNEIVRAEIVSPPQRDPHYQVDDITAATLPGLCVKLLAAGFDPEGSVECYRPGRETWDIRAKTVRAGAALAREGGGEGLDSRTPQKATQRASAGLAGCPQKPPHTYKRTDLVWQGLRLRLRVSDRTLAVLTPDADHPNLYRICMLDLVSDLANLTRAREAAVALALETLNGEIAVKQARKLRKAVP